MVEAEGASHLGDDSTPGQARAAALNNARRAALEKATGIEVHGSSTIYNYHKKELSGMDISQWVEETVGYEVRE